MRTIIEMVQLTRVDCVISSAGMMRMALAQAPGGLTCFLMPRFRPDGSVNPSTIHQGMKVRAGVKYVITKWFRERPWGW